MGERIDYCGEIYELANQEEAQEVETIILNSDLLSKADTHIEDDHKKNGKKFLWFDLIGGWRGGGMSCKELLREVFGLWPKDHPHVKLELWATYVENAPSENITIQGEEVHFFEG